MNTTTLHRTPTYYPTLTAAVAHEHVRDLLRAAERPRITDVDDSRSIPRRRRLWWIGVTARTQRRRTAAARLQSTT